MKSYGVTIQMKPLWQYFCMVSFAFQYFTELFFFNISSLALYSWRLNGQIFNTGFTVITVICLEKFGHKCSLKDLVLSIMLHAPLLLSLFARERGFYCFPGFCFSRGKHSIA